MLEQTAEYLAIWLGNNIDLLEPDVLITGGGAWVMPQPFFDYIHDRLPTWCINSQCQEIPLVAAHYGADAGIAGGAALCGANALIRRYDRELFPYPMIDSRSPYSGSLLLDAFANEDEQFANAFLILQNAISDHDSPPHPSP